MENQNIHSISPSEFYSFGKLQKRVKIALVVEAADPLEITATTLPIHQHAS
jgi:hypothetical protein